GRERLRCGHPLHRLRRRADGRSAHAPARSEAMNKKTLTALGAFVLLGIIALVTLRQPEKGERASDHPRPIPTLNPVEITTLDVTKGGVTTTIKNEGGIYQVTAPVSYPADQTNAKSAFEALGKMDVT